jgi:predicted acetyltransferase
MFLDPENDRGGAGARAYVVHEDGDGVPDGYVSYRKQFKWEGAQRAHTITVNDVYSTSPAVHAELWRFLLDLDLVDEVQARNRPLDDPLRWLLSNPRELRTTGITDFLWLLVVDVPAAMAARGYGAETELVLEIAGPVTERYRLSTGPTSAHCRRAHDGEKTDLVLGRRDLGAIYLGGCRPSVMAAAGRIQESRPGALARADAAFASPLAPFCGTFF